jgi:hypothetical protein
VATRALELNGVASLSDGGDDTGSLGGSDTDNSRTDGRYHARTGSMKKPAAFKPVSFAKFSVPKTPSSTTPSKIGEKGGCYLDRLSENIADYILVTLSAAPSSASPQPSTRPRLVAKTTSGLRDSSSKPILPGSKNAASAPDPSQVWNKNRREFEFASEIVVLLTCPYSRPTYAFEASHRRRTKATIWNSYDISNPGGWKWDRIEVGGYR